ncbi:MAG TPA: serine/threonine-protein kinase [Thermoanaerobaculia bacterium]|nr:serine/threonine-protein kinase [Thermoanaerobaculia bacterium]
MGVLATEIEATYEVLAKLGEGGMGAVYKVRHRFFDEIRIIKVMQAQLELLPELKERFLGEAKRGKQLRHPNLAEVIDFSIAADGTSYIVMEYIEGINLRELMARNGGPLDYKVVIPIAEQALAALGFLHSRKFVHRDISPDNLMLTDVDGTQRVKLIDLGIAKSLESTRQLTMVGKFVGKVSYASPEQFGGEVDARSDLYSFGVLLYELLTGAKPIGGNDYVSIIAGHLNHPPRTFNETDPQARIPIEVRAAVLKALKKRREDRYQTAEEFAAALRATLTPSEQRTLDVPVFTTPVAVAPALAAAAATAPTEQMTIAPTVRTPADATEVSRSAREPQRRWLPMAAVIALLFIGGTAVLWMKAPADATVAEKPIATASNTMTPPLAAPVPDPIPPGSSVTVAAPVVLSGQLVINAFPWAQVTSVVNAEGVEQLSGAGETPLVLSLSPGTYKVSLSNPYSKKSVVLDARVAAGETSRLQAELDRVDAASYVDGLGISQ